MGKIVYYVTDINKLLMKWMYLKPFAGQEKEIPLK